MVSENCNCPLRIFVLASQLKRGDVIRNFYYFNDPNGYRLELVTSVKFIDAIVKVSIIHVRDLKKDSSLWSQFISPRYFRPNEKIPFEYDSVIDFSEISECLQTI